MIWNFAGLLFELKLKISHKVFAVFFAALVIRGALLLIVACHREAILQPDSRIYIGLAQQLVDYGSFTVPGGPVAEYMERTPGYPLFLSAILVCFGGSLLAVVMVQVVLDSLSCVLIFLLSEMISSGSGLVSGFLACINMNMVAYSHFILNDSLFVFISILWLIVLVRFLKDGTWVQGAGVGLGIGIAAIVRPVVSYLPALLIPFLFTYLLLRANAGVLKASVGSGLVFLAFVVCVSPWMIRNYVNYGRIQLTAQSGEHLLQYVVPSVWEHSRNIPLIDGMKKVSWDFQEKARKEGFDLVHANPFNMSDFQFNMAIQYLKMEPKIAIAQAWLVGMAKNVFSPAIIDFSYLLGIERPHFSYTEGRTWLHKAWSFVWNIKGAFGWIVIGSLVVVMITRVIQLWGMVLLFRRDAWLGALLVLIIVYYLLVSGPVGYAKYRLPFEPILIVILAVGIKDLYGRWIKKDRGQVSESRGQSQTWKESCKQDVI